MRKSTLSRSVWFVGALATIAGCVPLQAQNVAALVPGTRVRVTPSVGSGRLVGTVVGLVRDTLTIQPEKRSDTVVVVFSEQKRLERSTGLHSHALMGAGIGLLVGVGGAVIADHASAGDRWSGFTAIGATVFGVLGTLVGATIGGNFPTEGWEAARVSSGARLSIAPRGKGRLALAYSVAF